MIAEKGKGAAYALEYKLEAVRLVQGGQACALTAKVLGIPKQTLENWVRQAAKGRLAGAGAKPASAEQMELARLRAELARVKMGRDILKKPRRSLRGRQRVACPELVEGYAWIERHKKSWPITLQCEVLNISASGYFESMNSPRFSKLAATLYPKKRELRCIFDEYLSDFYF